MRASGRDIVELFGYSSDDLSDEAKNAYKSQICPFVGTPCSKLNSDQTVVYGVCSVSRGVSKKAADDVIVCPKRLYHNNYQMFDDPVRLTWKEGLPVVAGGAIEDLKNKALQFNETAIAFGQGSGNEVSVNSNGKLSMDWVIQKYTKVGQSLRPEGFIGIEVQSIDITGNYRENWDAYRDFKLDDETTPEEIPNSGHGLNWANVHKRLIPQLIRKGNLYRRIDRCDGFFFLVPDVVYQKFEEVIGELTPQNGPARDNVSILTYSLEEAEGIGSHRNVVLNRSLHFKLADVSEAFISNISAEAPHLLDQTIASLIEC